MERFDLESLGQRIVQAAQLAVAMHLYQAVDPDGQHGRVDDGLEANGLQADRRAPRQRVVIGGTGPRVVDDAHA